MTATQEKMITIEVEPEDVTRSLPENFVSHQVNAGQGFSNLELTIPTGNSDKAEGDHVSFMTSYDGEGELLASVLNKPANFSDEECEKLLQGFFMAEDEDDEDEEGE